MFWIDLILVDPELYLGGEELHGDLPAADRHHHPLPVRQERPQSTAKLGWCHSNIAVSIIWTSNEQLEFPSRKGTVLGCLMGWLRAKVKLINEIFQDKDKEE